MVTASPFELLVAIDLRGGRVVRLRQGDFERETAFSDDPVATARRFAEAGVRALHVVDLDGARTGSPVHAEVIHAIVRAVGSVAKVEVAGGIRTRESVRQALRWGAARVVIGTAAIRDAEFAAALVEEHGPGTVAVAIDIRDARVQGEAWSSAAADDAPVHVIARLVDAGVTTFEVTAIDRDGTLAGPDLALYRSLVDAGRGEIIASGGISSLDDLVAIRAAGCVGAIVGRAIYEGRLSIADTLSVSSVETDRAEAGGAG